MSQILLTIYLEEGAFIRESKEEEKEIVVQYSLPVYSSSKDKAGNFIEYPNQNPKVKIMHRSLIWLPAVKKITLKEDAISHMLNTAPSGYLYKKHEFGKPFNSLTVEQKLQLHFEQFVNDNHGKDYHYEVIE